MALDVIEQIEKVLVGANKALILLPEEVNGDLIGSGWAFYFFLKKRGIDPTLAFAGGLSKVDERFGFLTKPEKVEPNLQGARDFVLSFNIKYNKIMDVRSVEEDEELKIYITPQRGSIDPRDFSFIPVQFKYDCVVVLGSPDKESVGKLYEENPDIFYEMPVINIDFNSNNENFGQVNFVNITASSVSEMLYELFERKENVWDENISECLLTGILSATGSFQNKKTTPRSLQIASALIDKGADQQKIIRHLYKTQPLHILKLWGRVMSRINWDEGLRLVWSSITLDDFVQSRAKAEDLPFILNKIKDNYSSGKLFVVFYNETPTMVKGMIKFDVSDEHAKQVAEKLSLEEKIDEGVYQFSVESATVMEAERHVISLMRE